MRAAAFEQQHATRSGFRFAKRVVIKVGTPVATHIDGNIALGRIGALVEQIAQLRQEGRDVVVITSGAIGTGSARMRRASILSTRLGDSLDPESAQKRVDENAGRRWPVDADEHVQTLFARYNMSCAQVLVTESDIDDEDDGARPLHHSRAAATGAGRQRRRDDGPEGSGALEQTR